MLVSDEKRLRWCGMDMRPRWRRRVAVALTYAAFVVAVWVHPWRTAIVVQVLLYSQMLSGLWSALEEAYSMWVPRVVTVILLMVAVYFVWNPPARSLSYTNVVVFAVYLMIGSSVVGWRKLVEPGGGGWLAQAVAEGEAQSWRMQRRLARIGFAVGLDGFAWYEYGMRFKKLTEEQKLEIEQMRRMNPRGTWMRERRMVLFDDERMRQEDDRMRARVLKTMTVLLIVSALGWSWIQVDSRMVRSEIVVAWVWTMAVLSMTLRQAIPLWMEDDPRMLPRELQVVEMQEA